jgi:predicted site-specific integrase-resolvase
MENFFNEYIESLQTYRWVGVQDLSEELGVSKRTIFQYIRDGKFKTTKWKGKRLIDTISVMSWLLKKKSFDMRRIKDKEVKFELERDLMYD